MTDLLTDSANAETLFWICCGFGAGWLACVAYVLISGALARRRYRLMTQLPRRIKELNRRTREKKTDLRTVRFP